MIKTLYPLFFPPCLRQAVISPMDLDVCLFSNCPGQQSSMTAKSSLYVLSSRNARHSKKCSSRTRPRSIPGMELSIVAMLHLAAHNRSSVRLSESES